MPIVAPLAFLPWQQSSFSLSINDRSIDSSTAACRWQTRPSTVKKEGIFRSKKEKFRSPSIVVNGSSDRIFFFTHFLTHVGRTNFAHAPWWRGRYYKRNAHYFNINFGHSYDDRVSSRGSTPPTSFRWRFLYRSLDEKVLSLHFPMFLSLISFTLMTTSFSSYFVRLDIVARGIESMRGRQDKERKHNWRF